jgi:hypothetical protein
MINFDNNLIIVKGEDKTSAIESWRFDKYKPVVFITYKSNCQLKKILKTVYID